MQIFLHISEICCTFAVAKVNDKCKIVITYYLMKMVVEGLHGEFAAFSGNALLLQMANRREILALPPEIDFKGTMIMVRVPAQVPDGFNLYDYMS